MRFDDDVVGGGIAGDDGLGRFGQTARETGLVAQGAHVACAEGLLGEGLADGGADVGGAVAVDEAEQLVDLVREMDLAARDLVQVHAGLGAQVEEPVTALGAMPCLAACEELFEVGRIFDVTAAVPAADMVCDLDAITDYADALVVGSEVDGLADVLRRDGVVAMWRAT